IDCDNACHVILHCAFNPAQALELRHRARPCVFLDQTRLVEYPRVRRNAHDDAEHKRRNTEASIAGDSATTATRGGFYSSL
ncbi:MAG TPA: hypothetical protein VHX19_09520, partial [Stellaceae bacterium]|nr:hypothetical protein [Stellaceae bacterium]